MEEELIITEQALRSIVDIESRKLMGIILKRLEVNYKLVDDKKISFEQALEILKSEIRELIPEGIRSVRDAIKYCGKKESIKLEKSKENENGQSK